MANPFVLSVLDQSPVPEGSTGADALRNTLDLARLADELGYHRYWLAEHHGGTMLAGPSPEVLIGPVAMATSRIRVGSGGVMLPHYSPLKVAESFSILAGLFPDRIDLALGRAPGTDPLTTFALQRDRRQAAPDDFPTQLAELLGLLEDRLPHDHPFARLSDLPGLPHAPEPWLLGSSPQSGIWAAELGLPYAFADFINPTGAQIAARYRTEFVETGRAWRPRAWPSACGPSAPRPTRRRSASPPARGWRCACCAAGARSRSRRPTRRVRFLESEGQALDDDAARAPHGGRLAADRGRGPARGRRGVRRRRARSSSASPTTTSARRRSYELIAEAFDLAGAPRRRSRSPPNGYRRGVADAPAPAPGVRDAPRSLRPAPALGAAGLRHRGPRAHRPRRRARAPAGRAGRARDRRRALAPLPALRQLAGAGAPDDARARAPARAATRSSCRCAGARCATRSSCASIAVNRAVHFFVLGLLGFAILLFASHRATFRDRFYRVVTDLQGGAVAGGGHAHITGCWARSTSSSRCSPRACTSSPS